MLIATAFVERAVTEYLRVKFAIEGISAERRKQLLDGTTSLFGSFWAASVACRAFGLITKADYTALDKIREIRNAFAHSDFRITLNNPQIQEHINWLRTWPMLGLAQKFPPPWKMALDFTGEKKLIHQAINTCF